MKHRLKRVEEAIKRELGELINRTLNFDEALPTIHEVSISADLRKCHVYIGVLGKKKAGEEVVRKLEESRAVLQAALSKRVIIKYTPHLHFHLDSSVERGVRVLQLLDSIPPIADDPEDPASSPTDADQEPEPIFETDLPEDDEAEDLDAGADLDEDEDEEEDEDDLEDDADEDAPAPAAPARRKKRPRDKRVPAPED